MNNFCEECGNKLSPADKFCDQCGTSVPQISEPEQFESSAKPKDDFTFSFFKKNRIRSKESHSTFYGIVLINSHALQKQFGKNAADQILSKLEEYISYFRKSGMHYLVLDNSDNHMKKTAGKSWKHQIDLLRQAIKKVDKQLGVNARFLLLFGGHEFIPMPVFQNPNKGTSDADVDSDLPYATLSVENPASHPEARTPQIAVGRFPTGTDSTAKDLITLMENTQNAVQQIATDKTFGLSALVWQEVSALINSRVCKDSLYISPGLTTQNLMQYYQTESNIHYFNLHGSDTAGEWYGQQESSFPPAFTPKAIRSNTTDNIVGVEACYGARFIDLNKDESILLSALSAKTVSYVGSSRIAFGPSSPPMNLADVVIHDYLGLMQQGVPAGEAFLKARVNAFNRSVEQSPALSLLTLMEFNLFGDPLFYFATAHQKTAKSFSGDHSEGKLTIEGVSGKNLKELQEKDFEPESPTDSNSGLSPYENIRTAVENKRREITNLINRRVWDNYPEFKKIEPSFSRYDYLGKTYNTLTYSKKLKQFDRYLAVSVDEEGKILAEMDSK